MLKIGKNIIKLPKLPNGISYLHVTKADGSFGFISLKNQTNNYVKTISITNDGKGIKGSCTLAKKLASKETIEIQVIDNLERVLYSNKGKGNTFSFYPVTTLSNRHILVARLLENGKIVGDVYRTDIRVFFNGIEIEGYNIYINKLAMVEKT